MLGRGGLGPLGTLMGQGHSQCYLKVLADRGEGGGDYRERAGCGMSSVIQTTGSKRNTSG